MSWWETNRSAQQFLNLYKAKERGIVLFLGAGITAPYFPTWTELIRLMVSEVESRGMIADEMIKVIHSGIEKGALPEAASICKKVLGEKAFNQFLQDTFIRPIVASPRINDLKTLLTSDESPVRAAVTTNFDSLTSIIIPRHDLALTWNAPLATLKRVIRSNERFLFQIHGMISDPENIILTSEDYAKLENNSEVINILKQLLSENVVLYVGFGIQDRDFISVIDQIRFLYGGGWNDHFVIYPLPISGSENALQIFRYTKFLCYVRDITLIEYDASDSHKALDDFIHHLSNLYKRDDHIVKYTRSIETIASIEIIPRSQWPEEYGVQPGDFRDIFFQRINGREAVRGQKHDVTTIKQSLLSETPKTILIIGEAGIGKTTICRWLAKEISSQAKTGLQGRKYLSIPISLREFCPANLDELCKAKVPLLEISFNELSDVCTQENIRLLLLIDGLNEIGAPQREALVTTIHGFKKCSGFEISIMFTSRSVGVTEALLNLLGSDVPIYEIQRWSEDQLFNYLRSNNVDIQILSGLSKEMRTGLCLPLFAWLYIQVNRRGSSRSFHTIGDIFDDFIKTRLEPIPGESEAAQAIRDKFKDALSLISLNDKKTAIAKLAYLMTQENTVTIECGQLETCLKNVRQEIFKPMALELINSGIFRLVGKAALDPEVDFDILRKTKVMFLHQALQEYLTAVYISEAPENRNLLSNDVSMNAFWRDVPIYMMRLIDKNTVEGREAARALVISFINAAKPDFWTAARLISEVNPIEQSPVREKVADELISASLSETPYAYIIEAFAELGEYGRIRLLNAIQSSQQMETVIAIPESHLYEENIVMRAKKIPDRESVWRSFGRPMYILGELGEIRFIEALLYKMENIASVHLLYHIVEAFLSIVRLESDQKDIYNKVRNELQKPKWINHNDPIIAAYSAAIIREINPNEKLELKDIADRLIVFLHDKTFSSNEYFEDEFWQRAHGIDVLPEIADADKALKLMRELLEKENTSTYSASKNKGYQLIHSAIMKGAIRLQKRSQIGFASIRELIEAAIKSERLGDNYWACRHLENLLLLICTENEHDWLRDWLLNTNIPVGTHRVLSNVSHALISN